MSRIENLIAELCPEGVEFFRVGDIASVGTGSSDRKDAKNDGEYPFYVRSKEVLRIDEYEFDEEAILIPGEGGIGDIFHYVSGKYALHQRAYRISFNHPNLDAKFAYYYFAVNFKRFILLKAVSATVTSIRKPMITDFRIPIPPLEIQREIVKVLDTFTQLEAELEAELEARRRQYQYYRDALLSFDERMSGASKQARIRWATLGDICQINRGRVISKDYLRDHAGPYPVYSSQTANDGVFGFIDTYDYDFESITWTTDGANAGSVFYHRDKQFSITNVCGLLRVLDSNHVSTKFLYYALGGLTKRYVSDGMGNPKLMSNVMSQIKVPVPPLEEQHRIVAILDKFDALVNDLSSGLPAEIKARRQQYEHYRDRLLTFKEAA